MVCPRSTLSTCGAPIQMSARVWSIGIDVMEKIPSSRPHCNAISSELNATASTPGRKRCRSCHKVAREYGITNLKSQITNLKSEITNLKSEIRNSPSSFGFRIWSFGFLPTSFYQSRPCGLLCFDRFPPIRQTFHPHGGRHVGQAVVEIRLMPQLRGQHAGKPHLRG